MAHVGHQPAHHVQLVKAREDQPLFARHRVAPPFLSHLHMDELLQYVHHAVLLEHVFPQVGGGIAVRVGRVALAAVPARAGAALVEGQEEGVLPRKPGGHPHVEVIHGEIAQDALVELEAQLPRVAVEHPLALGVVGVLAGVLVFQLEGEHGDAVHRQHHVHALVALGAVEPLAIDAHPVGGVLRGGQRVQPRLRPEKAHAEGDAPMFEAVAQHRHQAVHVDGVVQRQHELAHGVDRIRALEPRPGLGLGAPHEVDQGVHIQPRLRVVSVRALLIPARRGEEGRLDVGFKALFGGNHFMLPPLLGTGRQNCIMQISP